MATNAPKNITWIVAVIIGVLGIVAHWVAIPVVTPNQYWFVVAGFVILAIATKLKGL